MRFLRQLGLIGSTFLFSFSALADNADVSSITARFAKLGIVVQDVAPSEVGSLF